jgi:hypothetical protein
MMFMTLLVPLQLMLEAACVPVFNELVVAILTHLHILHHPPHELGSVGKFGVFVQLPLHFLA